MLRYLLDTNICIQSPCRADGDFSHHLLGAVAWRGEERSRTPIGVNDLHIAAHARSEGLALVSNNLREFERVPGLLLENWA
jgi:predicted nucleic acid-binding protein